MKYALTIGIDDYPGTGSDLTGCVNDATLWAHVLSSPRWGFDVDQLINADATGAAILARMAYFIDVAKFGDVVVFTNSSHGSWTVDTSGDEADGRDEGICPADVMSNGLVTDDQLHDTFSKRRHGVRLIFISDSCHSGTVSRLAGPVGQNCDAPRVRYLPPEWHLPRSMVTRARSVEAVTATRASRPTALLMAGCDDAGYSYDGYGSRRQGAFTAVAVDTLEHMGADATYADWHREIRAHLPTQDIPQTPQLYGTKTQRRWPIFQPVD